MTVARAVPRLLLLAVLALAAVLVSIRVGAVAMPLREIADAVRGVGDPTSVAIVQQLRLPRALVAALVGAALAIAGATFQALLRNPLAEPYILGVSGGAAVGAVGAILLGWAAAAAWAVPAAAFGGAIVAILLVLRIAVSVGRTLDTRVLLLAGVVVGAFFNACILLALTLSDAESFRSAIFWMMGSFAGATWRGAALFGLYFVPALLLLLALGRSLDLMSVGEDTAAHLGAHVERTKLLAYGTASLLTAAAVAAAGVIGFVGLIVPHIVRLLWGGNHRFLLAASALLGAAFLVLADALARVAAAPTELPVGVVTAFVGVPFFVWLLRRPAASGTPDGPPGTTEAARAAAPATAAGWSAAGGGWRVRDLGFRYPAAARDAVAGVSLDVPAGGITAVLGPNGSGKSTLLRLMLATRTPYAGTVEFGDRPLREWRRRALARAVGVVPQGEEEVFPLSVRELVAMGRYPHLGAWRREAEADRRAVERAMRLCDVPHFAARPISTLSGGERQRARIARALAQEPGTLALDEPTVALDIRHEMAIFELLRELGAAGVTVLVVTHNLNLAARYADRLVVMDAGRVAAAGAPAVVLTHELVERVWGWPVRVIGHPGPGADRGAPQVVPLAGAPAPLSRQTPLSPARRPEASSDIVQSFPATEQPGTRR